MHTYVIRCLETKRVKVGKTTGNPLGRLAQLQTGSSTQLAFIAELRVNEASAHLKLREHWVRGEWFEWNAEVERYIEEHRIDNPEAMTTRYTWETVLEESCTTCGHPRDARSCKSCQQTIPVPITPLTEDTDTPYETIARGYYWRT